MRCHRQHLWRILRLRLTNEFSQHAFKESENDDVSKDIYFSPLASTEASCNIESMATSTRDPVLKECKHRVRACLALHHGTKWLRTRYG